MNRRFLLFSFLVLSLAALYHRALTEERQCRLKITLIDSKTQKLVPGVIRCVRQSDGQAIPISDLLARGQGLDDKAPIHDWYVIPETREISLPRQPLRLEAFAGVESELATISLDLSRQNQQSVRVPLRFFSHVAPQGWYAGNTHLHLSDLNKEQADRYLKEIPPADRLDILFISYLERAILDKTYVTNRYPLGDLKEFGSTGVLLNNGEEHRHNFGDQGEGFGHVMFLNIKKLVQPVSTGPGISHTGTDGTPLQSGIEEAHRQGGVAIWCHNNWGMEDVPNFVAGKLDAQNIFDGGEHGTFEDSFYHYLNAGIRVPFSTGTDWFMYDLARVYTRVSGPLGIKSWLDALVAGRSFITNGPLLKFSVDGREIGDTVELSSAKGVQVKGEALGRIDFEKLELVQNGKVISQVKSQHEHQHFQATLNQVIQINEPSWFALRVSARTSSEYGQRLFGHTSPIYVKLGGRFVRMKPEVDYLIQQMKEAQQAIASQALFPTQAQREQVLSVYGRGIEILRAKEGVQ